MTPAENQIVLPKISPSSQLRKKGEPVSGPFQFRFQIHGSSGALLFLPDSDTGYLEAVLGSQHREPESHIDQSTQKIAELIARNGRDIKEMTICGVSNKDLSLLNALEPLAGQSLSILFPHSHCLEVEELFYELISDSKRIDADIIIARHIVEHVRDIDTFITGLREAIEPGALCIIEVPDSTRMLTRGDITQLWEEHTAYFTPSTLRDLLEVGGFDILREEKLISDGEDLCLFVAQVSARHAAKQITSVSSGREMAFLNKLPGLLEVLSSSLETRSATHDVWLYGANHISGVFLDVVANSNNKIRGIIDDDPSKRNQLMSTLDVEIHPYDSLFKSESVDVLVAVAEGRAPALYSKLARDFPAEDGHGVQSLVSFSEQCWEKE